MDIKVKLDAGAYLPVKAYESDAGFDLRTPEKFYLYRGEEVIIDTGVHIGLPAGWCGLIVSKSGLNVKDNITTTGLIDAGYTGSIRVKLDSRYIQHCSLSSFLQSDEGRRFEAGDKIAQLIILPVPDVQLMLVNELDGTERGENGFGSSGR